MTAKIKLNAASGGGSFSLQAPSSSSNNRVFTLPDSADATLLTSTTATGKILQVVQESKISTASGSVGAAAYDYSSGLTGDLISKAITPSNASNKILIRASLMVSCDDDKQIFARLYKDGSVVTAAVGDSSVRQRVSAAEYLSSAGRTTTITHEYLDTAGGTSAITYSYRFSHDSSSTRTIWLNRSNSDGGNTYSARGYSSLTLTEISA